MTASELLYLDANAGVAASAAAVRAYREAAAAFANPSSPHLLGQRAAELLAQARGTVAAAIGAMRSEIVFCSGGTEANALAILGTVGAIRSASGSLPHIVTTSIEHPSVADTIARLVAAEQIDSTVVPVERSGRVDADAVVAAVRDDTALVAVIAANNETGVLQPIGSIGAALRGAGARLHTDAVQAVGRIDVDVGEWGVDLLALSGHKLGAVGGIGALYGGAEVSLQPLLVGGGQEAGLRASTENVAGAVSLAAALAERLDGAGRQRVGTLRDRLEAELSAGAEQLGREVEVIGRAAPRSCNTSCIRFVGCAGDALMMALDLEGIAISTGSACASGSVEPSPVLLGMGLSPQEAIDAVRYSLSDDISSAQIDRAVAATLAVIGAM